MDPNFHEVTLIWVVRSTEIQDSRSTGNKACSSGVSKWKAVSSASTRHFAARYSRRRRWKSPLGLGGASGVKDNGGGDDDDDDDAGSGGGRQAEIPGSLQQAALEKMVRRKRYQFKVLAHHGSVRRNGNPFLQAANGLHAHFFVICITLRGHTDIMHTPNSNMSRKQKFGP